MALHPSDPPPGAWAVTLWLTPAARSPYAQAQQTARMARALLRRAARLRGVAAVHLAQTQDPRGAVATMYPDECAAPAGNPAWAADEADEAEAARGPHA